MTSENGVKIIKSGWRAPGNLDAIELGSNTLPSIDPFDDIDPLLSTLEDICNNVGVMDEYIDNNKYELGKDDENDGEDEYYDVQKKMSFLFFRKSS